MTKLLKCKCQHSYQDKKYAGKRVHNMMKKSQQGTSQLWRCTVCGDEKTE